MASGSSAGKDIKESGRKTPYDVRTEGTFAEKKVEKRGTPRALTPSEVHANNHAKKDLGNLLGLVIMYIPLFRADLRRMNEGKRGRPYEYSDVQILWMLAVLTAFEGDFRLISGFVEPILSAFGIGTPSPSRLCERGQELAAIYALGGGYVGKNDDGVLVVMGNDNVTDRVRRVGIDSTGISLSCPNAWRKKVWGTQPKDRGWLKLHALFDVDSGEMIAYAITRDNVGDSPMLKRLIEAAEEKGHIIGDVYADGAYSSNENWRFISQVKGRRFVTSFKSNTVPKSNGCAARGEAARLWCSLPYAEWVKVSGYGTRWKCECGFSDLKRLFFETLTARTELGMVRQLICRADLYNIFKKKRAERMVVTGNGVCIA